MTFTHASSLALLASGLLVILLYFLRPRSRRYDVSALYLWQAVRADPQSRAATLRQRLGVLLLLQLLFTALIVVAIAGPAWLRRSAQVATAAIVIDVSASMRAVGPDGRLFDEAQREAIHRLEELAATTVAVVAFGAQCKVVVSPSSDAIAARQAVSALEPTWQGDGTGEALVAVLRGIGGETFDRVILLTDRPFSIDIPGLETWIATDAENTAITAFHVRQPGASSDVEAFVRVQNAGSTPWRGTVAVSDGITLAETTLSLPPFAEDAAFLTIESTEALAFTASIAPSDGFPGDDVRYATLPRSAEYVVRWFGPEDPYVAAALCADPRRALVIDYGGESPPSNADSSGAALPVAPDLIVAHDTALRATTSGNVLLLHAGLEGLLILGEEQEGGEVRAMVEHPLLRDIDTASLRVRERPDLQLGIAATPLLVVDRIPILLTWEDSSRRVVAWTPSIQRTNLPISVDLPLLARNILDSFGRAPTMDAIRWHSVGEVIALVGFGSILEIRDPRGASLPGSEGATALMAETPGVYWITAERGRYPVAVNVPLSESESSGIAAVEAPLPSAGAGPVKPLPIWTAFAALALLVLLAEAAVYHRIVPRRAR